MRIFHHFNIYANEAAGIKPNERLGQHFLIDLNLMRLLVDSADIQKTDIVLEVGCGTGSLTSIFAEKTGRIVAVELDRNLIEVAKKQFENTENIDLFGEIVGFFMGHRRKTMLSCTKLAHGRFIKDGSWLEIFEECSVNSECRPDQLCPEKYLAIAQKIGKS